MNELFVNIKVDREERPDIDQIYMAALHHAGRAGRLAADNVSHARPASRSGAAPIFRRRRATAGRPLWTYCAKWRGYSAKSRQTIEQNRTALMERLEGAARKPDRVTIGAAELDKAAQQLGGIIDPVNGGTRGAPKFPQAALFELLWRAGLRTGEARYFGAVDITLHHICEGGIYDHLGGGFARYSVDERWLVPHFEKMLYDNAQLLELLAVAYARLHKPLYRQRAQETVGWLAREMTTQEGAFSASLNAQFGRRGGQVLRLVVRRGEQRTRRPGWRILRAPL